MLSEYKGNNTGPTHKTDIMNCRFFPISLIILMLFLYSCEKPIPACGCDDPRNELKWLKEFESQILKADVLKVNYHENEYIGFSTIEFTTSGIIDYYDCDGNYLCTYSAYSTSCPYIKGSAVLLYTINNLPNYPNY